MAEDVSDDHDDKPCAPQRGRKRIAFVTTGDARDFRFWSGTPRHMGAALAAEGHEIIYIGPLRAWMLPVLKGYSRICRMLGLPPAAPYHSEYVAAQYGADAARRITAAAPDLVFAPASSAFAWNTPPGIPMVLLSDATYRIVAGYHPKFRKLSRKSGESADRIERKSIARADLLLYPSRWAADSAINDYGADPGRVHVIPWGANLAETPARDSLRTEREPGPWRLLLVGVSWVEKGAAIAVEALRHLRANGVEAELTICGCVPPEMPDVEGLTVIPFLKKSDPEQGARLKQLFRDADFFILPTRADCYGMVLCEAAAYGLPSIATATGGLRQTIVDGETGFLLPMTAGGSDYARTIEDLIADPGRLAAMRASCRDTFESRLNWTTWAARVSELLEDLPPARRRQSGAP